MQRAGSHSSFSATTGCTRAAFSAGTNPATAPATTSSVTAVAGHAQVDPRIGKKPDVLARNQGVDARHEGQCPPVAAQAGPPRP